MVPSSKEDIPVNIKFSKEILKMNELRAQHVVFTHFTLCVLQRNEICVGE